MNSKAKVLTATYFHSETSNKPEKKILKKLWLFDNKEKSIFLSIIIILIIFLYIFSHVLTFISLLSLSPCISP